MGIEINREDDGGIQLSQSQQIDSTLEDVKLEESKHEDEGGQPLMKHCTTDLLLGSWIIVRKLKHMIHQMMCSNVSVHVPRNHIPLTFGTLFVIWLEQRHAGDCKQQSAAKMQQQLNQNHDMWYKLSQLSNSMASKIQTETTLSTTENPYLPQLRRFYQHCNVPKRPPKCQRPWFTAEYLKTSVAWWRWQMFKR